MNIALANNIRSDICERADNSNVISSALARTDLTYKRARALSLYYRH